jgi:hypothetical protein
MSCYGNEVKNLLGGPSADCLIAEPWLHASQEVSPCLTLSLKFVGMGLGVEFPFDLEEAIDPDC